MMTRSRACLDIDTVKNMKRTISLILALVFALLPLTACAKGNKFVSDGAAFVDKKTDVTYDFAPLCYEPIAIGETVYGSDGDIEFYEISGQDEKVWKSPKATR